MPPPPCRRSSLARCRRPRGRSRRRSATSTRTVRPREPPMASATTGHAARGDQLAHGGRVARADVERPAPAAPNMLAPPTSTASRRTREAPSSTSRVDQRRHGVVGELVQRRRRPRRARCSRAARRARARRRRARRSTSASPMHEPSPSETSTSPAVAETASSPMRTIVSHHASPSRASSSPTPSSDGHEHERDRAVLALDRAARSRASARRRRRAAWPASTVATIAPSMSVAVCGGVGLDRDAGHRGQRVDVGGADDVADLAERGRRVLAAGLDAEQPAQRCRRRRA